MALARRDFHPRLPIHQKFDRRPLCDHWQTVCATLNAELKRGGVPIRFHWKHLDENAAFRRAISSTENGPRIQHFLEAYERGEKITGMVHDTQLRTLAAIVRQLHTDPSKMILVLGAMMCGKTGTANSCHWLGPIFYLLAGRKYYPMQLLPVRKASADQTKEEFAQWLALYQELRIEYLPTGEVVDLQQYRASASNVREYLDDEGMITLNDYRRWVMQEKLEEQLRTVMKQRHRRGVETFDQLIHRRSKKAVSPVSDLCKAATKDGFAALWIIDEPHWGSRIGSVQDRMLTAFREIQAVSTDHMMICFDATPFSIANAEKFAVIRHRLGKEYCGPNCWGGAPLDPAVQTKQVLVHRTFDWAVQCRNPDFALVSRRAYAGSVTTFRAWLKRWNSHHNARWQAAFGRDPSKPLVLNHMQYKARVEAALRAMLHAILLGPNKEARTRGVCLRLLKSNEPAKRLIHKLIDPKLITPIPYMSENGQNSVKQAIENEDPEKPYVLFVTGAARMADWFPQDCTHFLDFTDFISNQVSLMQGSYGRACGYGEPRHVIMMDRGVDAINAYLDSDGLDGLHPGKDTSVPAGRRGAPLMNVRLARQNCKRDPIATALMNRLQSEIIDHLPWCDGKLPLVQREMASEDRSYVPFWAIFNDSAFRHLESQYKTLLPECSQEPTILRSHVSFFTRGGKEIRADLSPDRKLAVRGFGKIGVRDWDAYVKSDHRTAGMLSKGKHWLPTDNNARYGRYQPQIWLDKDMRRKRWIVREVVLRLFEPVRPRRVQMDEDGSIYASETSTWKHWHSDRQKAEVSRREAEKEAARERRKNG